MQVAGKVERLTVQVADWLVGVVVEAEHSCMSLRDSVAKPGARTVTSALRGVVRDDPRTRQEFLSLARRNDDA
ncbi:MAG TPA: GTP cyclohydrolase I [Gaiellales bacterium]